MLPWCFSSRAQWSLVLGTAVWICAVQMRIHAHEFKPYEVELGSVTSEQLGVNTDYRLLPFVIDRGFTDPLHSVGEMGTFQMASVGNYRSATGSTTVLASRDYMALLPSDPYGTLPPEIYTLLFKSNFLSVLNVKYLTVHKADLGALKLIAQYPQFKLHRALSHVQIFENTRALPRAFLATRVEPFESTDLWSVLLKNKNQPRTALVKGWEQLPTDYLSTPNLNGDFTAQWKQHGALFKINVTKPGFLVVSESYDPHWYFKVDEKIVLPYKVDGVLFGVGFPAGTQTIELVYSKSDFWKGLGISVLGLLLFIKMMRPKLWAFGANRIRQFKKF